MPTKTRGRDRLKRAAFGLEPKQNAYVCQSLIGRILTVYAVRTEG